MTSPLKQIISEMIEQKLTENKSGSLHTELKKLGDTHYQAGGSGSESKTTFRGARNTNFDAIHKQITGSGHKKVYSDRDTTEYHKNLNDGKNTSKITVTHDGKHVYSVGTITQLNRY
jgi:hypothetical protein